MMTKTFTIILILFLTCISAVSINDYPIDGYKETGIRRLLRLELIMDGEIKDAKPIPGALKKSSEIKLNLLGPRGDELNELPIPDPGLQKSINSLFPNLDESYSIALLDITEGKPIRYAQRKEKVGYQPGSVGKIAVAIGLFSALKKIYPDSFEKRKELLRSKFVKAGKWAIYDEHTVPFFDPETKKFFKRQVQEGDIFSLYEWADHMLSVSNNGAASVVWREVILMNVFDSKYPALTEEEANAYFSTTPKSQLSDIAIAVVNDPLREIGIGENEWRLGTLFTKGAGSYIPGKGGSTGSPLALMKFMIAMERGQVIDMNSSLELKKLLYMTDRRIRYASSAALTTAAVYFKSGSLYSCKPEEGFECKKYHGNVSNYMNSIAIVEHPDGTTYMVALMSNVLKKNSSGDHYGLASQIDRIVRKN